MAINTETLHALTILGADNNVASTNCVLRQNQTTLLSRSNRDTIVSMRNEILHNRGYAVPEGWDTKWRMGQARIWSPQDEIDRLGIGAQVETWILPEYFSPETDNPTKCMEATNRVTGTVVGGFEHIGTGSVANMPDLVRDADFRNFEGLVLDGNTNPMRGDATTMWNVADNDFMLATLVSSISDTGEMSPVFSKWTDAQFSLHINTTNFEDDIVFYMNNVAVTINHGAYSGAALIIVCGRKDGKPFVTVQNGESSSGEMRGDSDTTDIDYNGKPWMGDMASDADEVECTIHECIFMNGAILSMVNNFTTARVEQLQGYLAWKYDQVALLEDDHAYKTSPPRGLRAGKQV